MQLIERNQLLSNIFISGLIITGRRVKNGWLKSVNVFPCCCNNRKIKQQRWNGTDPFIIGNAGREWLGRGRSSRAPLQRAFWSDAPSATCTLRQWRRPRWSWRCRKHPWRSFPGNELRPVIQWRSFHNRSWY